MTTIEADELVNCIGDVLKQVRDEGEVVEVVEHGTVVARVVPVVSTPASANNQSFWDDMEQLAQEIGKHAPKKIDAVELVREIRD